MPHKNMPARWPDPTATRDWKRTSAAFNTQLANVARAMDTTKADLDAARQTVDAMGAQVRASANTPASVAAVEGLYLVRAGVDPAYATPEARDALLRTILAGTADDGGLWLLTPENRARVAAAASMGWVVGHGRRHPTPRHGVSWHRQLGDTAVRVGP